MTISPSIITKLRARTSASQISSFLQCQRRWHIGWVLDEKSPPTDAMLRGTAIHALVEKYLLHNAIPDGDAEYERRTMSALELLPPPGNDSVEVEQEIDLPTYEGGPQLYGRFDAIDHTRRATPTDPRELRTVYDCKTTSDFKYAKTPEQLADDVQLGGYAKHELELYPQDEAVRLRHVYIRTRGAAKSLAVDVVVSREQINARHGRTIGIIREMQAVLDSGTTDPNELPPNTDSCGLYGGCPHRSRCGLESSMSLSKLFSTKPTKNKETVPMSSLLDRLRAKTNVTSINGAGAPAAAVIPPDAPSRTDDPTCAVCKGPIGVDESSILPTGKRVHVGCPGVVEKPKRARKKLSTESTAHTPEETAALAAVFDKVLKPTTPPGASLTINIKAEEPAPTATAKPTLPRPTVYVDCVPTKGPHAGTAVMYEEWLAPIIAAVAEELQIVDWRLAEYGKGEGILAAAIRAQLSALPDAIVVNGISKARGVFLECVCPLAKDIIKGV